jgi:hypothetical protein
LRDTWGGFCLAAIIQTITWRTALGYDEGKGTSAGYTTFRLCAYGGRQLLPLRRLWTGYEADAELICVTGREKVQAIDHAVVTTYE